MLELDRRRALALGAIAPLFAALSEWSVNLGSVERARLEYDAREDPRTPRR